MNREEYIKALLKPLKNATLKEKAAVSEEISAHISDHADALEAAGWSREDAEQTALAAMGDPEEIGSALNKEFPKVWRIISVISTILLVVLIFATAWSGVVRVLYAGGSLVARISPKILYTQQDATGTEKPIDIRLEASSGDVVYFYNMRIAYSEDEALSDGTPYHGYIAYFAYCIYDKNPFSGVAYGWNKISSAGKLNFYNGVSLGTYNYAYGKLRVPVEYGQETVVVTSDLWNNHAQTEIDLDWGGVDEG